MKKCADAAIKKISEAYLRSAIRSQRK